MSDLNAAIREMRNKVNNLNAAIREMRPKRKNASQYQSMIVVRMPMDVRERVRAQAQDQSVTMSDWIRRTVEAKLRRKG
jgi:hypothetical protein